MPAIMREIMRIHWKYIRTILWGWLGVALLLVGGTTLTFAEQNQLPQTEVQGFIDLFTVNDDRIIAQGWIGVPNSSRKVISLSIWLSNVQVYDGAFKRFNRPDVINAPRRHDWINSGWSINTPLPRDFKNGEYLIKVLAKLDNGAVGDLALHQKTIQIGVGERLHHFTQGVLLVVALLLLLFCLLFAEKFFPAPIPYKKWIEAVDTRPLEGEAWFYRVFFFTIALVGWKLLLMKFIGGGYINLLAVIVAGANAYIIVPHHFSNGGDVVIRSNETRSLFLIIVGVLLYLGWIYARGIVLPANDPVAVPTFASVLNQGTLLHEYYMRGESGATYPPGFPLLLSFAYVFLNHAGVLLLFKILCILAVALLPLSWAWFSKRIFNIPLPLTFIAIAFYIAAFGIERTLNYALPFAGKNAQLFLLWLFPLFVVYLVKTPGRNGLYWLALGFLFYCLTLFHYSVFYVALALLAPVSVIWFLKAPRQRLALVWRWLFVGLVGLGCFIAFSNEALHDPRRAVGGAYDLGNAFETFIKIFFGTNTLLLSIFNSSVVQDLGSPMRGYLLIGCLAFSASVMWQTKNQYYEKLTKSIFLCSGAFFIAIVIAAAMGCGLIPVGVSLDFYRWFIFPAQMGVIACALLSAHVLLKNINSKVTIPIAAAFLLLVAMVFVVDTVKIKKVVDSKAVFRSQIQDIHHIFISGPSGCGILAPNRIVLKDFSYAQKYRSLEYAEMLTGCRMLAGSWVHAPNVGWREDDGMPGSNAFSTIPTGMTLYFVGTLSELDVYGKGLRWDQVGLLPREQVPIWKRKAIQNEKPG
jgi:hypothetical protein